MIVDAESDINSWEDIRGKRVFIGPPAGSFGGQTQALIKAITGMKNGDDYEGVKLGWSAANQSWEDGKFDVFMRPGTMGSAAVDQFGSATSSAFSASRRMFLGQLHGINISRRLVMPPTICQLAHTRIRRTMTRISMSLPM